MQQAQAATSAGGAGEVLIFAEMLDEATADEDDYAVDLEAFVLHGSGLRSEREVRDLIALAGLEAQAAATIGWGYRLLRLRHNRTAKSQSSLR
ncbi:hypothetical protein [Arenivirga flava]|uniref:hypothetical protein n=1 Tax=Arenivirga flava TaxID=1930060 RepID=UPI0024E0B3BF|nr:hypothetical protein [Arenivirga flava]